MTINRRVQKWWKQGTVYQIYPASFCDSNGDGVGDLGGVKARLEYLHSLGVRIIWICPMYDSPQVDMGYDISDYEKVYAPYGTLEQMEKLIEATHGLGMRIMLDLVINHTSDKHAWFQESRSSKDNPKRDWYIWRPAKYSEDGTRLPPNNWRSNFGGGSAWEWDEATGEYYLHLFAKEQPDLNWEKYETRKAIYDTSMHFWLERGVDGFRVDTVNMYSKPPGLPDAPITDPESLYQPAGLLYCNGPRMHEFLSEMNEILHQYDAVTVGELPHTPDMSQVLRYVSAEARQLDMVFQFDVVDIGMGTTHKYETTPKNFTLPQLKAAVGRTQDLIYGTDAWTTVFLENHDQARSVSRFADDSPEYREDSAKMLALFQCCLSGTLFIYQGQELGCVNAPLDTYPIEQYADLDSHLFLDKVRAEKGDLDKAKAALQYLARDHARIPMAWDGACRYGGFSAPAELAGKPVQEPWMPPHPLAQEINMRAQLHSSQSVYNFWRQMLRFRQDHSEALIYGNYRVVRPEDPNVFMFTKESQRSNEKVLVMLNFTRNEMKWSEIQPEEVGLRAGEAVHLQPIKSTVMKPKDIGLRGPNVPLTPFEGRIFVINPTSEC
ncbi:glucan 1,6-alpha-glucosidase [Paramyrothecium foliicola]|nr:glucan 1,6-alpha-glucosidase [Paramyrothecium foliicola]